MAEPLRHRLSEIIHSMGGTLIHVVKFNVLAILPGKIDELIAVVAGKSIVVQNMNCDTFGRILEHRED